MSHSLCILPRAARQLAVLPPEAYCGVRDRIRALASDPLSPESAKIPSRDGWKVYAEAYRVIYSVDSLESRVTVIDISRRSDA